MTPLEVMQNKETTIKKDYKMAIKLNAEIRKVAGKGAARAVRKNQNIPAVIYGEKKEPVSIELNGREFNMLLVQPSLRTKLFEITTANGKEDAMLMDIQYHPVSDKVVHVDFKRINVKEPVARGAGQNPIVRIVGLKLVFQRFQFGAQFVTLVGCRSRLVNGHL